MRIGVPREIKADEYRVAMLPVGVEVLTRDGHIVLVESGAGLGSGISDEEYAQAGARIVSTPEEAYGADLIVKVKEPQPSEYRFLHEGQVLFTYFHFAANEELTEEMRRRGVVCVAYETIQTEDGTLPLLTPMSEVAGRMAIQEGAKYLERPMMGRGILLSGLPGVAPADVVIVGGGVVGMNAAKIAAGLGANVTVMDINVDRMRYLSDVLPPNVTTLFSDLHSLRRMVPRADLLIGAVLIPGARTPKLITAEMVQQMKPGAVIVDVSIDQGGCVETIRPTTHQQPTFIEYGVVHYGVTNMPGAVGRTSTYALCNVTLPYVRRLANEGWRQAMRKDRALARGLNIAFGRIVHPGVAEAYGEEPTPLEAVLGSGPVPV
ncbi:MAG: alanine dehydrogenase [Candidatus Poribacteria bacterium]|nr:MAG: alanine dehydrogenase [Candidatus Poribacteria bacterium]